MAALASVTLLSSSQKSPRTVPVHPAERPFFMGNVSFAGMLGVRSDGNVNYFHAEKEKP